VAERRTGIDGRKSIGAEFRTDAPTQKVGAVPTNNHQGKVQALPDW